MTRERSLTAAERAHIATAEAHLAAVAAVAADPARLPQLEALLAQDFTWCIPSANPARGVTRSRSDYLGMLANPAIVPEPAQFAHLELRILATTVQGDRLAAESESVGWRRDGLEYHNYYHQVWRFDAEGRIVEYRIYDDSEHVAATHTAGNLQVVHRFLAALATGDSAALDADLAESFTLVVPTAAGAARTLDKPATLAAVAEQRARGCLPDVELLPDGITACGDRIAVEARTTRPAITQHHLVFQLERYRIAVVRDYALGRALLTAAV
jgi:ketosteroid isomerase-like protein